ncbi:TetR family transcriptional regulator [Mycolicibacterium fortuitum subsp. acetamidolyticum]|uniref:TetR family transcriptional regulator n=1 Tax=Mycolicibacterium fortuitum subsp. acetamidolyticum TaxID=144550 RepID=A0A100WXK9_MYCFO|nr:TetR family transcriptional regulator [Mycolicibacterium fortuitum subsp. acetamidolyticum]
MQWPRDVRIEFFTAPDPAFVDDTFARFVDEFLLAPFAPAGRSGEKEAR